MMDCHLMAGREDALVRDLDPILKGEMGGEGNQIIVNAYKGKHLLWDEL